MPFLAVNTSAPPKAMAAGYSLLHLENSLPLPIVHCSATLAARSDFPFTPTPSITMNDFHTPYKGHPQPQLLTFLFSSLLEPVFLFIPLHILKIGFQTSTMPANGCDLPMSSASLAPKLTELSLTLSLENTCPSLRCLRYHLSVTSQASPPNSRFL